MSDMPVKHDVITDGDVHPFSLGSHAAQGVIRSAEALGPISLLVLTRDEAGNSGRFIGRPATKETSVITARSGTPSAIARVARWMIPSSASAPEPRAALDDARIRCPC